LVLAGAAAAFAAASAMAYFAGYLPVPSLIIASGAAYLAYMTYLTISFRALTKDEAAAAAQPPHQALDNWLGAGVGRIRPGSPEAAMHLELGTLSPRSRQE
jgi:hypothetical protein